MKTSKKPIPFCDAMDRILGLLQNRMNFDSVASEFLRQGLVLVIRDLPKGQQVALFPADATFGYMWEALKEMPKAN